jgi:hypothetical protein
MKRGSKILLINPNDSVRERHSIRMGMHAVILNTTVTGNRDNRGILDDYERRPETHMYCARPLHAKIVAPFLCKIFNVQIQRLLELGRIFSGRSDMKLRNVYK